MTYQPKISVITVSFNVVDTIEETILSVLNQTYPHIEYIIIDGGSTDGTVDIIKKYSNKISHWVSEQDKGIYDAMNKGIEAATGQWINFMNSGDTFYNSFVVKNVVDKLIPDIDIAYGDTIIIHLLGKYIEKPKSLNYITQRMVFGHQATFVKTQLHKEYNFDTSFRSSADYNFFYKMFLIGKHFQYLPLSIANYDATIGMSKENYFLVRKENARIHGKDKSILYNIEIYTATLFFLLKQKLKYILPQKIVLYYKKKNFDKLKAGA